MKLSRYKDKASTVASKLMAGKEKSDPINGGIYDLILKAFDIPVNMFFREVYPRGAWKIPKDGAIILVAAPHANQVSKWLVPFGHDDG